MTKILSICVGEGDFDKEAEGLVNSVDKEVQKLKTSMYRAVSVNWLQSVTTLGGMDPVVSVVKTRLTAIISYTNSSVD
jgi:hypothetical protein